MVDKKQIHIAAAVIVDDAGRLLLVADIFRIQNVSGELQPAAEIEEVKWVSAAEFDSVMLAPLTAKQIIPQVFQTSYHA